MKNVHRHASDKHKMDATVFVFGAVWLLRHCIRTELTSSLLHAYRVNRVINYFA